MRSVPDLTTRSRIREVAMKAFAADGYAGASVRRIAAEAGVSPALVMHHFGSKDGLRTACDEYLIATLTHQKGSAVRGTFDAATMMRMIGEADVLLAYLARGLTEGSDHAATLFDDMVSMAEATMAEGEAAGAIRDSADPRARAALMVAWQVSLLVLGEHLARAVGTPPHTTQTLLRLSHTQTDLLTRGLFTDDRFVRIAAEAAVTHQELERSGGGR